jgi:hypothetical protein
MKKVSNVNIITSQIDPDRPCVIPFTIETQPSKLFYYCQTLYLSDGSIKNGYYSVCGTNAQTPNNINTFVKCEIGWFKFPFPQNAPNRFE